MGRSVPNSCSQWMLRNAALCRPVDHSQNKGRGTSRALAGFADASRVKADDDEGVGSPGRYCDQAV